MTPSFDLGENLNLRRRPLPGLLAKAALTPLGPLLRLLQRPAPQTDRSDDTVVVFASYMVGDFFMALPALKMLAAARPVRILCRPDCVSFLTQEGLQAIAFDNALITHHSASGFNRTLRAACALRQHPGIARAAIALDLDASPLSALWLRLAGFSRVISYRRAFSALFTETFALPADAVHQADRDLAVVEHVLKRDGGWWVVDSGKHKIQNDLTDTAQDSESALPPATSHKPPALQPPWLLSVWTRKAAKNWPLSQWDEFLKEVLHQGVVCSVLSAPDGDADYRAFRARWETRVPFVGGTLDEVATLVRQAAGVIATDNFLGHMAGYYGKPVLWINMCSPAAQVRPRGPHTLEVAPHVSQATVEQSIAVDAVRRAFAALRGI